MVQLNIILSLFLGLPRWSHEMLYVFLSTLQDHQRLLHFTTLKIQSNYFITFCRSLIVLTQPTHPTALKMITDICQIKYGPCTGTVQITRVTVHFSLPSKTALLRPVCPNTCTFLSQTGITSCTHQTWPTVQGLSRQSSPAKQSPLVVAHVPLAVTTHCLCLKAKHVTRTSTKQRLTTAAENKAS